MDKFKQLIRGVPDFPKKGILFYDITTLLKNAQALKGVLDELSSHYRAQKIDLVVGIESRGFIFAPALACQLGAGFVPVRKPGKLPAETIKVSYDLEYGTRYVGNSQGWHSARTTGAGCGRSFGHRRDSSGGHASDTAVGRRSCWLGVFGRAGFSEWHGRSWRATMSSAFYAIKTDFTLQEVSYAYSRQVSKRVQGSVVNSAKIFRKSGSQFKKASTTSGSKCFPRSVKRRLFDSSGLTMSL